VTAFLRVWFSGYFNPAKFSEGLKDVPAPHWGLYAQLLRGLMDSIFLYLPLFLMGRIPPTPSYIAFIPTENYYGALVWIAPLVFTAQWLLGSSVIYIVLRLSGTRPQFDLILNISGMVALTVGAFLVLWDWIWIFLGGMDQVGLGISHLVIDIWGGVLVVVALNKLLRVPVKLGIVLYILVIISSLPLAIMFMRSPV
jgi:hypothetical protein